MRFVFFEGHELTAGHGGARFIDEKLCPSQITDVVLDGPRADLLVDNLRRASRDRSAFTCEGVRISWYCHSNLSNQTHHADEQGPVFTASAFPYLLDTFAALASGRLFLFGRIS
jgi:hypothetical protein